MSIENRKKWIVFDAMGVIFKDGDDTGNLLIPMVKNLASKLTYEKIYSVYLEASLGMITAFEFWKKLGFENDDPQIQQKYLDEHLILDEQFKQAAEELSKSYKLAMLSNDVGEWSEYLRNKHDLNKYFDEVIISSDVKGRKPSKEIYEVLLKRIGADPEDCLFINDREKNLDAAKELGIKTILFKRDVITGYKDVIIHSLSVLPVLLNKIH